MIIAHRIQLLPNNAQRTYFRKACGVARFAWNWALARWEEMYQARKEDSALPAPSGQGLKKEFSALIDVEWPWMRETTSYSYQRVFPELEQAYKRFFKGLARRPRFKKKGRARDSFYLANTCIRVEGRRVRIQKLGWVRLRHPLRFQGKIMSARVSREADKWFIAIAVEMPDVIAEPKQPHATVGVDLGVSQLAALSTGETHENPKALNRYQRQMKRLQRQLRPGKRQRGSRRYRQLNERLRRLHRRIRGIRGNALHQLSASLVKRFAVIGIEDLNVSGMVKNRRLARVISDASFSEIRRQLGYKAGRTGAEVIPIGRFEPSSKTCSACGSYQKKMPLSVREWTCPDCGVHHDRDINAAKNIRRLALNTRGARGIDARGDDGSAASASAGTATSIGEPGTRLGRLTPTRKSVSGGPRPATSTAQGGKHGGKQRVDG